MVNLSSLYNGLGDINLAKLDVLNKPVTQLNEILARANSAIQNINGVFLKQASSIQDAQFDLASTTVKKMVDCLNGYSEEVYASQRAVEQLFMKIVAFEPQGAYNTTFCGYRRINFSYKAPSINTTNVINTLSAYKATYMGLDTFKEEMAGVCKRLMSIDISGWRDSQARVFQQFANELASDISSSMQALIKYKNYLGVQIRNLG